MLPFGSRRPWYSGGLRFECTGCAACCEREGDVFFEAHEAAAAVELLSARVSSAREGIEALFTPDHDGRLRVSVGRNERCPFLVGRRCSIHPVKPEQCRTYPFWPEVVKHRLTWTAERRECEGIDSGDTVYSRGTIEAILAGESTENSDA